MIATAEQIKSILGWDDSYDTRLDYLIPFLQRRVSDYCNNRFLVYDQYRENNTISFTRNSSPTLDTINDSESKLITDGLFADGIDIWVTGSKYNDNFYPVKTAAADKLTLNGSQLVQTEAAENYINIYRVRFPYGIEIPFAQYMKYHIFGAKGSFDSQESLPGGYSVMHKDERDILNTLFKDYRKPYK